MADNDFLSGEAIMVFKKEILDSHSDFTRSLSHQSASPEAYDQENVFSQDFQPFMKQDKETQNSASQPTSEQSLANRDPCTVPDDLREEMMRQRRKEDAFKTALCDAYKRSQACSYGDQCRFAHGVHELRLPMNVSNRWSYKFLILWLEFSASWEKSSQVQDGSLRQVLDDWKLQIRNQMPVHPQNCRWECREASKWSSR